jgi:hypothetical protein
VPPSDSLSLARSILAFDLTPMPFPKLPELLKA